PSGHVQKRQAIFGVPASLASDGRKEREDGSVSRRSARGRSRTEWEGDRSRNHRTFSSAFGSPESTPQRARGDAVERARLPAGASGIGAASVGRSGCVLVRGHHAFNDVAVLSAVKA